MSIQAPLIQPDVNNDNNSTNIMHVDAVYATSITDGIATIENGYISNLKEPTLGNEIATKGYIDNSGGGGGGGGAMGPNNSLQYNSAGSFAGSANLTLTDPGLSSATLNINGTLTNGTMTMVGSQISGLTNPTNPHEAATKNYVDNSISQMSEISVILQQNISTIYTPEQVYNKIVNLSFEPDNIRYICLLDSLPAASQMKTYLGSEFVVGKSWLTIFKGPQHDESLFVRMIGGFPEGGCIFIPKTYIYCDLVLSITALVNYSVATILSVVTNDTPGSEQFYSYVISDVNEVTEGAQITDQGILTPSFGNGSLLGIGSIIYPIPASPILNNAGPIVYTYSNLQKFFIIRTGLVANTSDTFVSAATFVTATDFSMGGGTFRFFIQNPTLFDLTLTPSSGWSFQSGNSNVIPAGHCGAFWLSVVISPASCVMHTISISPING